MGSYNRDVMKVLAAAIAVIASMAGGALARQTDPMLERAKRLLATEMPIKCVAYATGFSAPSNFAAAFLRVTGETPRQYRQRASRKNVDAPVIARGARNAH